MENCTCLMTLLSYIVTINYPSWAGPLQVTLTLTNREEALYSSQVFQFIILCADDCDALQQLWETLDDMYIVTASVVVIQH